MPLDLEAIWERFDNLPFIQRSKSDIPALIKEVERARAEIEEARLIWRCERHGGHDPDTHCYPCHTEELIRLRAENERLRAGGLLFINHMARLECESACNPFSSNPSDYCLRCQARMLQTQPWWREPQSVEEA